jgi:hypothetical protein
VESERSDKLARRIRTVERVRRPLAILIGLAVGLSVFWEFDSETALQDYGMMLSIVLGIATWWIGEIIFAGVLAVFETDHHRTVRSEVLPRAVAIRK